jgi:hypothetical protein
LTTSKAAAAFSVVLRRHTIISYLLYMAGGGAGVGLRPVLHSHSCRAPQPQPSSHATSAQPC